MDMDMTGETRAALEGVERAENGVEHLGVIEGRLVEKNLRVRRMHRAENTND